MSHNEVAAILGEPTYREMQRQFELGPGLRRGGLSDTLEVWTWGECEAEDLGYPQHFVSFAGPANEPVASWKVHWKYQGGCGDRT